METACEKHLTDWLSSVVQMSFHHGHPASHRADALFQMVGFGLENPISRHKKGNSLKIRSDLTNRHTKRLKECLTKMKNLSLNSVVISVFE